MARKVITVEATPKEVEFYSKEDVVLAIRWIIGVSKAEAQRIYRTTSYSYHNEVAHAFKMNARRAFYAD